MSRNGRDLLAKEVITWTFGDFRSVETLIRQQHTMGHQIEVRSGFLQIDGELTFWKFMSEIDGDTE